MRWLHLLLPAINPYAAPHPPILLNTAPNPGYPLWPFLFSSPVRRGHLDVADIISGYELTFGP